MTIHFASARNAALSPFARALIRRRVLSAANDNSDAVPSHAMVEQALRHFARFGLGAAAEAHRQAEAAFFSGDRQTYDHWLDVCRILDRRVAMRLARRIERDRSG